MSGFIWIDNDNPVLGRIRVEDYPDIDPGSEDGRERLRALASSAGRTFPELGQVLFIHKGKQIGEMMLVKEKN